MQSKDEPEYKNINVDNDSQKVTPSEEVFGIMELVNHIVKIGLFTDKDVSALSKTSKELHKVLSEEMKGRKLLTHVVLGEQDKAEAMIKANPRLLLIRTKSVDYSGRTIIGTAFQGAIGAGDKPMWKMMLPYFEDLEQGEALRQFHEQFPNGIEDDVFAVQLKDNYNALALAIMNNEDHGLSAIEGFRKEITSQKEITEGKHFNLQHLLAAYQAYIDNFDAFDNWDKRDRFWQKVIGGYSRPS